ncbi:MAG TPA: phosphotransferase, partial [Acidimicrobiales bacterium]|nr:phosphotransferase [Acidimicrobiales bacterium]
RVVEIAEIEDCPVLVTAHVDAPKATPDVDTLRSLGDLLGRLHTMPVGDVDRPAGVLHHWAPDGGGIDAGIDVAQRWLDRVEPKGDDVARLDALRSRLDRKDTFADLPSALCHPDYSHDNALAGPVLVDWSGGGVGPRVHGVLTLLLLALFRNPAGVRLDLVDAALTGYREHVQLTAEEVDRMTAAMRYGDPVNDAFGVALGHAQLIHVVAGWDRPNKVMDEIVERVYSST